MIRGWSSARGIEFSAVRARERLPSLLLPTAAAAAAAADRAWPLCRWRRSHLMVDHEDRSAADKFSVSRLRRSMRGANAAVPSSVHGAPQVRSQPAPQQG